MTDAVPAVEMAKLTPAEVPILNGGDAINLADANFFGILFYVLLSSMSIRETTVRTESKEISSNATLQYKLNKLNASITFSILPDGADNTKINQVQERNQRYAAIREDIQNALITARQNAQVMMTQTSTNVNILQQDASEDSGWLETLNTIFQVVDQMTQ